MKYALAIALVAALGATSASAAEIEVSQKDKQFSTQEIAASVGDVIVFHNDDNVAHNVHSTTEGHRFNLGLQKPGESSRLELNADGTVAIRCAVHPKMKLVVTVK